MKYSFSFLLSRFFVCLFFILFCFPVVVFADKDDNKNKPEIHTQEKSTKESEYVSKEKAEESKKHQLTPQESTIKDEDEDEDLDDDTERKDKNLLQTPPEPKVSDDKSHPSEFKTKYRLKNVAQIAINIMDSNFFPINTFIVCSENLRRLKSGTKRGINILQLWDGKDMYGNEAPPGEYYACISVIYRNGKKETIGVKLVKD